MPLRNFGLSFFRRGARPNPGGSWRPRHAVGAGLVVLLVALWTALVHAGAADHRRKLARASKRVPLGPHVTTPAGTGYAARWGAARPLPQRREILHQADIAGPFGMEGRSDRLSLRWGIHARRHEVPGW